MPLPPEQHAWIQAALLQVRTRFPGAQLEPAGIPDSAPIFRCLIGEEPHWIPYLPGDLRAYPSLMQARRVVHTYEVQHLEHLQEGFGPVPDEAALPSLYGPPARKRFETHEVVRVPVEVEPQAKDFLETGNQQTTRLTLALSEAFGSVAGVRRVTVALSEPPGVEVPTLLITAEAERARDTHSWHIRTDEVLRRGATKEPLFQARHAAAELVRLYLEHQQR